MDSIRNKSIRHLILFCLITFLVLCVCAFYVFPASRTMMIKSVFENSFKSTPSPEQFCNSSGNGLFHRDHLRKLVIDKSENNSAYVNTSDALKQPFISHNYSNLTEFIVNTRAAFMSRRLKPGTRPIPTIFRNPPYKDMVRPSCDGLWMEFGVFHGATISIIAKWKTLFCGNTSEPVYGFDTFQGLPTDWRPNFGRGMFGIANGTILQVPPNVKLIKGLFIDTLPIHLRSVDDQHRCHSPVSFVHIDCDIYDGARDVLFLLGSRFVTGTIIVFDELFNYPTYEKHEIKALYEFVSGSNLRLIPLGSSAEIDLNPINDKVIQMFAFVVTDGKS